MTKSIRHPRAGTGAHTAVPSQRGKSERITVLLPPELHARVCDEAARRLLSMSAVIREVLVRHYRNGRGEREA